MGIKRGISDRTEIISLAFFCFLFIGKELPTDQVLASRLYRSLLLSVNRYE